MLHDVSPGLPLLSGAVVSSPIRFGSSGTALQSRLKLGLAVCFGVVFPLLAGPRVKKVALTLFPFNLKFILFPTNL